MIARRVGRHLFSGGKNGDYIPIRPLRDSITTIYDRGGIVDVSTRTKVLAYSPSVALLLEGIINEWSWMLSLGSLGLFTLAGLAIQTIQFTRSHHVCQISVTPKLNKFYLLLPNNAHSRQTETQVLASQGTTFQKKLVSQMKSTQPSGWASEEAKQRFKQLSEEQLLKKSEGIRYSRDGIILELSKDNIKEWRMLSQRDVRKQIYKQWQKKSEKKKANVLEEYRADPEKATYLTIETHPMAGGYPFFFCMPLNQNVETKYQEYLTALGRGQRIANI